jgi:hypothetical protein
VDNCASAAFSLGITAAMIARWFGPMTSAMAISDAILFMWPVSRPMTLSPTPYLPCSFSHASAPAEPSANSNVRWVGEKVPTPPPEPVMSA